MPWNKLRKRDYVVRVEGREQGREEGIEQGLKVGLVNLVRQGLLTARVASQQLGMTVAEFEELL